MHTPIRILVADDSDTMRHAICNLLQAQAGITISGEAGNYAELLKIFNATTTDVVLMDVRMEGEKLLPPPRSKPIFTVHACLRCPCGTTQRLPALLRATEQ